MYTYNDVDKRLVQERAQQFRNQVERRVSGDLTEEEFRPLRLQNGLYLQLHAYMLRVAIPYGYLSSTQLRKLAHIARRYDKGYGHFTTRQNIQFNWPKLSEVPDILNELASVEMHAIQTSGNCVRNTTSDPLAGSCFGEEVDPRPYCEILRQWSTLHPEFAHLPRKFKIAVTGAGADRAAILFHDIGIRVCRTGDAIRYEYYVGGGQGRTPQVGVLMRDDLDELDLLSYTECVLRVYNEFGRRDNKYKARIKILVKEMGLEEFRTRVEAEWQLNRNSDLRLSSSDIERMRSYFPDLVAPLANAPSLEALRLHPNRALGTWAKTNVEAHKYAGHAIVHISLKSTALPPGDMTATQMDALAAIADQYAYGQLVVDHRQNLVLPAVRIDALPALFAELFAQQLATANIGSVADIISCPGLDYCDLANARSIPVARAIADLFTDEQELASLGQLTLNISGCINACGHHHAGNIGILGIDKQGEEFYQITLGGSHREDASIGKVLGRAFNADEIAPAVRRLVDKFREIRAGEENFLQCVRRVGNEPFKHAVYGAPVGVAS